MKFDLRALQDTTAISHEFVTDNISDLLEHLEIFIKASGFCFDGELNIFLDGQAETVPMLPTVKKAKS